MHLICSLEFCITFVFHSQPRSQGSLLPALRKERERARDPGKRWSRISQNLSRSIGCGGRGDPWERGWE